ncbi:precorrin-8X methylmutase [Pseudoflavonifractor sp.]|jgi:precorrin-8X/cobalt-precorrin-8 methylmutase|uniref:precorrin-8X methylmutase n=1 Tax=Pseudoflavonifractor sp. TaxID=1980281 RepID=UPI003D92059B
MSMKVELQRVAPAEIEKRSMEIITAELGERSFPAEVLPVVKRVIHTSADFDYADNLVFSPDAVAKGIEAIRNGCTIVTDTQMAWSGVNKRVLEKFGGKAVCFMSDPEVAAEAKARGETRATVSMERAAELEGPLVFAIGNAPTALVRLCQLIDEGKVNPALVIGVPVGFVNVVESKELMLTMDAPHIVARGRKGGSNVAAAICNALIYQASGNARE